MKKQETKSEKKQKAQSEKKKADSAAAVKPAEVTEAAAPAVPVRQKRFDKKHELLIVLLSISVSFTIFFFSPAELFIRNQKDYLVGTADVLIPMLLLALAVSAGCILLMNLMLLIHEKVYLVVSRLVMGVLLAFYMQEMFLNGKMAAITGDPIGSNLSTWDITFNCFLNFLVALLPLFLELFKLWKDNIIPYLAALMLFMQGCGLGSSFVQFGVNRYERLYNAHLSYEPTMSMSNENNVVVFLADRLDGNYMDEMLELYPELYNEFNGFTFYQNNVAHYTNTFPSITHMFTGKVYEGGEWADYLAEAWDEDRLFTTLKENDYHINLMIDNLTTYTTLDEIIDKCDNITQEAQSEMNYTGEDGVVPIMTKLSFGRLVPYYFKAMFIGDIESDFSAEFVHYNEDDPDSPSYMPGAVGVDSDLKYYEYLLKNGLTNDNPNKTFTFLHLCGAHNVSSDLSALNSSYNSDVCNELTTARGDFEIIFTYIQQLKSLGIYDNTTIIILGDHGRPDVEIELEGKDRLDTPILTGLLIKPQYAESAPLKLDAVSELSNDNFAASVLEYADIDHESFGYSYNDIIENELHVERTFQAMKFINFGNIGISTMYRITGDARDLDNWEVIPN